MSGARGIFLLALAALLAGCSPRPVRGPAPAAPPPAEPARAVQGGATGTAMPAIGEIDRRLAVYREKSGEWQAFAAQQAAGSQEGAAPWAQCLRMANSLQDSYGRLREAASGPGAAGTVRQPPLDPWAVLRADIAYLESGCDGLYRQVSGQPQEQATPVDEAEMVVRYVEEQRYEDALAAFRSLERRFPGKQLSLPSRRAYGLALLYSGQLDKAAKVLREVLPQLPEAEQLAAKRLNADLLLATYQIEEAKSLYQSLSYQFANWKEDEQWVADQLALLEKPDTRAEEMAAYIDLLRIYLTSDGRERPRGLEEQVEETARKFPGSMIAERGRQLLQRVTEQSRGRLDQQLAAAEALLAEKRYPEALAGLKELEQRELPPAVGERVRQLIDQAALAEAREKEQEGLVQGQDPAGRWEEASHLLDLQQYDEASRIFATLLGTEYEPQARAKLKEAANRATAEKRRQAANLFVKARESTNADRKLELLLESRRLLKTIIEKYPQADIIDKVMRNLEVIDQQVRQLKPGLVLEQPASGGQ